MPKTRPACNVFRTVSVFVILCVPALAADQDAYRISEIARGHSWVSPYWGYSSPKIVFDGKAYYSAGLWGDAPDTSHGVLYKLEGERWRAGRRLEGIYQPATLALDGQGRLIATYNRQGKPLVLLRSKTPGDIENMAELPPPPEHSQGFYVGTALRGNTFYLAWIVEVTYTMYLARLDMDTLAWSKPVVVQEGQVETKPKTAWTYPILYPDEKGLHFVASNAPDGGDGNTYNQVWYLYYPDGAENPSIREKVAECQVGHFAYALDMAPDRQKTVHIVYLYNQRKYGDPLPPGSEPAGTYHAWRDAGSGAWRKHRMMDPVYAGFFAGAKDFQAVTEEGGTLSLRTWQPETALWTDPTPLCPPATLPAGPGFLDVISAAGGSSIGAGIAAVSDGLLPKTGDKPAVRILWALLPAEN